jgi:hypothetical protein
MTIIYCKVSDVWYEAWGEDFDTATRIIAALLPRKVI